MIQIASLETKFDSLVKETLQIIASQPTGKRLLDGISREVGKAQFGYTVCICHPRGDLEVVPPKVEPNAGSRWEAGNLAVRVSEENACNGVGTPTAVTWNAKIVATPDGSRPPFIGLAHELIHAFYNLRGEAYAGARDEELRTVGLTEGRGITENMIRAEHNIPLRTAYTGL